jgi:hypothetical protein
LIIVVSVYIVNYTVFSTEQLLYMMFRIIINELIVERPIILFRC